MTLSKLFESLLCINNKKVDWKAEPSSLHPLLCTVFLFCYVWSIGGNLVEKSMETFDNFVRDSFSETHDVKVCHCTCVCILHFHNCILLYKAMLHVNAIFMMLKFSLLLLLLYTSILVHTCTYKFHVHVHVCMYLHWFHIHVHVVCIIHTIFFIFHTL